ncbi:MAG: hypothetical protein WD708_02910 [Kiritimatiellia bacterium]
MFNRFLPFLFIGAVCFSKVLPADSTHSLGLGAHYWRVVDDLGSDFDDSGVSYLAAYRYSGGLVSIQPEVEVFPKEFGGGTAEFYSPQILAILGDWIYAGVGVGILYSDGDFAEDPFFMFRAGFNIIGIGPITLDINANYIFTDWGDLSSSDIDSDTITLGAMVRVKL